jgi:hypothetical protein
MALVLKDRVKETSTTAGTGTLTLAGAVSGFQSFAAVGNGNTTYYAIVDSITGAWEVGIGTYTSSGTTLSRTTILSSSNGGSLVSFAANPKDVFVTYPSEKSVYEDASNVVNATLFGAITATSAALTTGTISTTPVVDIDLVNKQYVDTVAAEGIHYHEAVFVESPNTTGNLTSTYANGGTNSNIIQIDNGTDITFFGYTPVVGDQFVTSTGNGLLANTPYYIVALVGSACQISLTYGGPDVTGLTNGGVTLPSLINPGVGATLTNAGTQVALTIDGVLMTVGKRVLIYNQTNAFENGVYTVTTVGTGSTNWVLTRATDADTYSPSSSLALGQGDAFYVTDGDTGAGESYVVSTNGDIFFGITAINFAQISSAQIYNAGTGLNLSPATTFNISNTGVSANTYGSASAVPVFAVNAQGQITGVTNTNIAISGSAVSGSISGSAGSVANALTLGTYLTGTSFNGSAAVTATVDATSANTASKVVARDSSGNFSAGTITAALSGNATTATTATNTAGGAANQISYNTAAGTTAYIVAPTTAATYLNWTGSAFAYSALSLPNALTINNGGAGGASGSTFNGSSALTISYNTVGAPSTGGTGATGTWGISISGNAATATSTTSATTATNLAGGSAGTIPYQSAAGTTVQLAAGTSTYLLQSNGAAAPSWVAPVAAANNGALTMAVSGTGLSGSASFTANQAGASSFTVTSNATSANTASTIVARDASGNFTAGTITAALSGNATTATTAANVNNGTLTMNVSGTGLSGSQTFTANQAGAATFTVTSNATNANTASAIVARDASGNFSAGTITAALTGNVTGNVSGSSGSTTGNAATATALQTARNIGGVSFNGTANIDLPGVNTSGNQNTSGNAATASNASLLNSISAVNLYNNMGNPHSTYTSFDATTPSYGFGYRYVQGNTNGPGTGQAQYYSWYIGLGSDYPATGAGSYGAMFAVGRTPGTAYLSVRYNENNSFGSWQKVAAGFADSATSATTATTATNVAGGAANQIHVQTGVGTTGFISNGTAGQVLTANASGAPTFQTATSSGATKSYVQAMGILRGL